MIQSVHGASQGQLPPVSPGEAGGQREEPRFYPWREAAVLGIMGMELSWLSLWFRIFTQTGLFVSFWRAYAVLGGTLAVVYLLARLFRYFHLRLGLQRGLLGGLLSINLLIGLKALYFVDQPISLKDLLLSPLRAIMDRDIAIAAEFMVLLVIIGVWRRGISLVGSHIGPGSVKGGFLTGALALFLYGLIAPLTGETPAVALYLYLFFGLLAMIAARVHGIGQMSAGRAAPFDRKWLGGALLSTAGIVSLSIGVVSLVQWKLSAVIVALAIWLWRLVFLAGMTLLTPVMLLLMAVVPWLAKFLQGPILGAIEVLGQFIRDVQGLSARLGQAIDRVLGDLSLRLGVDLALLKPVILLGILLLGSLAVVWSLGSALRRLARAAQEDPDSVWRPGEGLRRLSSALRSQASALAAAASQWVGLRLAGRWLAATRIRRIYASLLKLSERLGKPRPAAHTPLEYLPQLKALFPESQADLDLITRAYLGVRYGELPEAFLEVQRVESAWRKIQADGRERLRAKK